MFPKTEDSLVYVKSVDSFGVVEKVDENFYRVNITPNGAGKSIVPVHEDALTT